MGDSPRDGEGRFLWLLKESDGPPWRRFDLPGQPVDRGENNRIWQRIVLPEGSRKNPVLYLESVDTSFQAFLDREPIYRFGDPQAGEKAEFPGWRWHIISLPPDYAGRTFTVRVFSDYPDIGVYGDIMLGSQSSILLSILDRDFAQMLTGLIIVIIGLCSAVIFLYDRKTLLYIYFALFFLTVGLIYIQDTRLKQLLLDRPRFWFYLAMVARLFLPLFLLRLFEDLFGSGWKKIIRRLWQFHILYCIGGLLLEQIGLLPKFIIATHTDKLLLFYLLITVLFSTYFALKGSIDARIYSPGFCAGLGLGIHDVIAGPFAIRLGHWGMLIIIGSQVVILIRHFIEMNRKIVRYTKRLKKSTEEIEQKNIALSRINQATGRFVPYEFLRFLNKESIVDVKLGDHIQTDMTIMFSDICSYTTLSETMSPQDNFKFLNAYLKRMGPIIRKNNGFVNQYYGDGIMALFSARPDDALQASIQMHQEVAYYNCYRESEGRMPITIGVGLHLGKLMLGIIGDELRMDSGVVSDNVNIAARTEGLTRMYGASILVSSDLFSRLADPAQYSFRFLDVVRVKGKSEAISIIEILDGEYPTSRDLKCRTRSDFERALSIYRAGDFREAGVLFADVLETHEEDRAAAIYLERCRYYEKYGVPPGWEGVEVIDFK